MTVEKRIRVADKSIYEHERKRAETKETAKDFSARFFYVATDQTNPFEENASLGAIRYVIPTNIPTLDMYLPANEDKTKRGFRAGAIHMFTADADNFKSTIMNRIAINVLNEGGHVYYIEIDKHWTKEYFLSGACGVIRDHQVLKDGHFHYRRAASFATVFKICSEIISTWKGVLEDFVVDYNKANKEKILPYHVYMPVNICPVVIIVDGFSSLFSEQSLSSDFGKTKTAEDNSDAHRMMKLLIPGLESLGITMFLTNHFRDDIQMFMPGKKPMGNQRRPYLWKSMQGYINTAIDIMAWKGKPKTVGDEKITTHRMVGFFFRKIKNFGKETRTRPIRFYTHRGFDVLGGYISALHDCGFAEFDMNQDGSVPSKSKFKIVQVNKAKKRLPECLNDFIVDCTYKEFIDWVKSPEIMKSFFIACREALALMEPLSVSIAGKELDSKQSRIIASMDDEEALEVEESSDEAYEAGGDGAEESEPETPKNILEAKEYLEKLDEDDEDGSEQDAENLFEDD